MLDPTDTAFPRLVSRACTAFEGTDRLGSGTLAHVALQVKAAGERGGCAPMLIFDDATGEQIDVDLRGSTADVVRRIRERPDTLLAASETNPETPAGSRGPGRPRLGVVAREVTLLPRHWAWLGSQPGGASVALRRLVDEARRTHAGRDRVRQSQEAAYRVMVAMAGNEPGFEEASRALFARTPERFDALVAAWPADVRHYVRQLAAPAFTTE